LTKRNSLKDPIIPKNVHIIWLGPKTPPTIFQKCLDSIKKHLPEWNCRIWTDKDIPDLNLHNKKFYDEESNYGAKSDILRYELLYKFGGVYLDVDMVVLKPLDILHHTYEFYAGLHPSNSEDVLGNAIIGSAPGHPILKHCIESIKDHRNRTWIISRTGPIHFEESFFAVASKQNFERVIALPASYLFPIEQGLRGKLDITGYLKPESFAVHCWANTWA
jgi:mannosyltransferase OCH1-like enzyme